MSKTVRTMVSVAVGLLLLSSMTMAQAAAKNSAKDKDKNQQQHSRLSKVAFWRHHSDADKNAKKAKTAPATPEQANAKKAHVKPVAAKQVVGKQVARKKDQKPEQHYSKVTKPSTKKAPVANKMMQPQEHDSKAGLLKH